jgi:ABC-type multidrug transport system ATPase subunit
MSGAAQSGPAVVARSLRKLFARERGAPVCALDTISLEANHGELTALVGPDGAGKTTLMRLIAGLLRADSGSLTVLGVHSRFRIASATCRSVSAFMRISRSPKTWICTPICMA